MFRAVAIATLGVAIAWALYLARDILLILYISVLLAIGLGPLVHRIERAVPAGRRLPRWFAILVIYFTVVGILTVVGLLVVPPLIEQSRALLQRLPTMLDNAQDFLIRYGLLSHRITLEEAVRRAPGPGDAVGAVGTVATALTAAAGGVVALVTVLILTFYLLVESDSLFAGFARLFPRAERPRVEEVSTKISTKVSAWLNGQLILGGTIGLTAAIGLYFIGVPYFYVLALLAAIGEMIPVVGPVFAAVPAIAVAFTVSPRTAIITALFMIAQQQFENHLLVPRVMARQVGVSAVIVIVALLIGGSLLGILGAILAVPTAAIVQVVVQELLDERDRRTDQQLGPCFD
jgi:predicted PurR-regulated permease PerM